MKVDDAALVATLKACATRKDLHLGNTVHAHILKRGLLAKVSYVANTLVSMYAKCGTLATAHRVLEEIPRRTVVAWSAVIAGYAQHGQGHDALYCFELMQREGLAPNAVTFSSALKACGSIGAADKGKQIHDEIVRQELLENNFVLGNALVDMYVKCGFLAKAQQVFQELQFRDVVSWNTMIAGYAQQARGQDAIDCYNQMQLEGVCPTTVTFICILKACGSIEAIAQGEEIHYEIAKQGLLGTNIVLGNALVDMYAKCGAFEKAEKVLKDLPVRTTACWNALISGYTQKSWGEDALNCFVRMQHEGLSPDAVTFVCILKACGIIGAVEKGEWVHEEIDKQGLLQSNTVISTALVDMYAKCGALAKAQRVLRELPMQDVVSWNALIAGYAQRAQGEEALKCFELMQAKGVPPDEITFTCILTACASMGAVDKGKQVHDEIVRLGLLQGNVKLGTALVGMYAKCGALAKAAQLLDELAVGDVVSWSALIAGYAQQGQCHNALTCIEQMQRKGLFPNAVIFSCVLNACCHCGLVDEGQTYFANMTTKLGIVPDLELFTCMVDLFGRAGHFDKAVAIIQRMPSFDHLAVWSALMAACQKWGEVTIGRWAFEHAVQVEKCDVAAYVCMTNIYAAAGMHEDARIIEAMRVSNSAWRKSGSSLWIDVKESTNIVMVEDAQNNCSVTKLDKKVSDKGCHPSLHWMLQSSGEEKERFCGHRKTPAIAHSHINDPKHIFADRNVSTSILSIIEKRNVVIEDSSHSHGLEYDVNFFGNIKEDGPYLMKCTIPPFLNPLSFRLTWYRTTHMVHPSNFLRTKCYKLRILKLELSIVELLPSVLRYLYLTKIGLAIWAIAIVLKLLINLESHCIEN